MANANITSFQRLRREQATKIKVEKVKPLEEEKEAVNERELSLEEVKTELDRLGVKYSHNTSEKKLREKLKTALEG